MGAKGQLTVPLTWTKCFVLDKRALVIDPVDIDRVTPLVVKADLNPWTPASRSNAKRNSCGIKDTVETNTTRA